MNTGCVNIAGEHAEQREEPISYEAGTSLERNLKRKDCWPDSILAPGILF